MSPLLLNSAHLADLVYLLPNNKGKGKNLTLPFRSLAELTIRGRSKQRPDRCMPQLPLEPGYLGNREEMTLCGRRSRPRGCLQAPLNHRRPVRRRHPRQWVEPIVEDHPHVDLRYQQVRIGLLPYGRNRILFSSSPAVDDISCYPAFNVEPAASDR